MVVLLAAQPVLSMSGVGIIRLSHHLFLSGASIAPVSEGTAELRTVYTECEASGLVLLSSLTCDDHVNASTISGQDRIDYRGLKEPSAPTCAFPRDAYPFDCADPPACAITETFLTSKTPAHNQTNMRGSFFIPAVAGRRGTGRDAVRGYT
jgi:hypothetical protein